VFAILRAVAVSFAVIVAACLHGPAHARTQHQVDWCYGKDAATLDQQISGCTAFIQSGAFTGDDLAFFFFFLGQAYL
jgi:hypothetical protein